jgi:flagellar biosynthesis protein FlhB
MADQDKDSKTELPTGKRMEEAADKGQFARSTELQVVATIAAALGVCSLTISNSAQDVASLATLIWSDLGAARDGFWALPQLSEIGLLLLRVLLPFLFAVVLAALLMGGFQSGFHFSPKALGFHFEKLDVIAGFRRLASATTAVHAGVDLLKLLAIGLVLWMSAKALFSDPMFTSPVETVYIGSFIHHATIEFLSKLVLALGIVAAISYAYERFRTLQEMKMTRQEVKDEHKQSEGDGLVKGALRRMARRLMQKQMLASVPTADVVVTNPTHYAVALKYERGRDAAPVVLAKGENRFALRIKALAAEHGVPVVENKPVARMLYGVGKVGEPIPSELFQAVAEILAFVYRNHRLYFHELKMRRAAAEGAATRQVA